MRRRAIVLVVLLIPFAASLAGEDSYMLLAEALRSPPATGVMVAGIVPGSAAETAGLAIGEVIVSYGGVPVADPAALAEARKKAAGAETVEVRVAGPEVERTVVLAPGPMGINVIPVVKGVPVPPLPPATVTGFDFSRLASGPIEEWYAFTFDGKTKVGFEHARLSLSVGKLVLHREVAFDGGGEWGLNQFDVTVIADPGPPPQAFATKFLAVLADWSAEGRRADDGRWLVRQGGEERAVDHPADLPRIPTYLVESLAIFLPREPGACFRFRPIVEASGSIGLPSALVAVGEEEVDSGGKAVKAFRIEQRVLGGQVAGTCWLDAAGRAVRTDYGGPVVYACTREEALADLPAGLRPR